MAKKKVLLMGKAHSGKTSMRSIIFANYLARDTMRLSPTLDVEHHHVRFLGDLVLNLWDCGGQDAFYESYFERDRETIFRSVEMLIYVFDIESDCPEKDFDHFAGVLEAIEENSPDARIFVLVHKMDLVDPREREAILEDRFRLIEEACAGTSLVGGSADGRHGHNANLQCFGTSIWDETLYKAWSEIVTNLIPNIGLLESHLDDFCTACDADEVVLFERATFLVISHAQASSSASANASTLPATAAGDGDGHLTIGGGGERGVGASDATTGAPLLVGGEQDAASVSSVGESVDPSAVADAAPHENAADDGGGEGEEGSGTVSDAAVVVEPAPPDPAAAATESSVGSEGGGGNLQQPPPPDNPTDGTLADATTGKVGGRTRTPPRFDAHRFEKISNIVKQFKLSCGKTQSQFQGMEVRNSRFAAYIDAFTPNTYIMVIVSDPAVASAATLLNIRNATRHFERFIPRT